MRKVLRARYSGTSAAEEPDDEIIWCDGCLEEKDVSEVEYSDARLDFCNLCSITKEVSDDE